MRIKKIKPVSLAKMYGLVMLVFGLLIGLFTGIVTLMGGQNNVVPAVMVMVGFPLMYGIMGFVMGLIGAVIYNIVASRTGGIEIEVE